MTLGGEESGKCARGVFTMAKLQALELHEMTLKGEVQSRINIISKERVKISPQIGAKMMKIG